MQYDLWSYTMCTDARSLLYFSIKPNLEILSPRPRGWRSLSAIFMLANPKEILIKNLFESHPLFHIAVVTILNFYYTQRKVNFQQVNSVSRLISACIMEIFACINNMRHVSCSAEWVILRWISVSEILDIQDIYICSNGGGAYIWNFTVCCVSNLFLVWNFKNGFILIFLMVN